MDVDGALKVAEFRRGPGAARNSAIVVLADEVARLRVIENRVIGLLDSADADVAQILYYGHHLECDENCAEDGEYWIYPGGKPQIKPVP